jgi:hypothetical protein
MQFLEKITGEFLPDITVTGEAVLICGKAKFSLPETYVS